MNPLTDAELEVMRILWAHGELKPQEILERFPREITNSTLRSFLTDLVEKGHARRVKKGKAFFYRAKTRQDSVFQSHLRQMVEHFCAGSTFELVQHLVKSEQLSSAELEELRKIAFDSSPKEE